VKDFDWVRNIFGSGNYTARVQLEKLQKREGGVVNLRHAVALLARSLRRRHIARSQPASQLPVDIWIQQLMMNDGDGDCGGAAWSATRREGALEPSATSSQLSPYVGGRRHPQMQLPCLDFRLLPG